MSTQLEAQAIELIQGFGPEQAGLQPDLFVIGNVVSRSNPLKEEILNRGLPYVSGPQWIGEHILYDKWVLAVCGRHPRQDHHFSDAGLDSGRRRLRSGFPDRWCADEFRHIGPAVGSGRCGSIFVLRD